MKRRPAIFASAVIVLAGAPALGHGPMAQDPNAPAPLIAPACPYFPPLNLPGVLCETFDAERNGVPGFQWSRLPLGADPNDPLRAVGDPNDDVLGYTMSGGPRPLGTAGVVCADSALGYVGCQAPVAEENDWHLHSPFEGPGAGYTPGGGLDTGQADGGKARSGFRSMHMGRHLSAVTTLMDTLRFRQVSAFVLDSQGDPGIPGIVPGPASTMHFWHIISVPDDENFGNGFIPLGTSFGGGQVQISIRSEDGAFSRWERLTPTFNRYDSRLQETLAICSFDPGDDIIAPANETMCAPGPVYADKGDVFGTDPACTTDTDGNDSTHKDCGDITCAPGAGCTEVGALGTGVWTRSAFDLSPFAARVIRLRWVGTVEGGWLFSTQRSALEPHAPPAYQYFDGDDGWWVDDIVLTDLRQAPGPCPATDDDGDGFTECQRDCDDARSSVYPGAAHVCGDGVNNDCDDPQWPIDNTQSDNDGDGVQICAGDCNDDGPSVYPGAPEVCDGLNNDCSHPDWPAPLPGDLDSDQDSWATCAGDCDDSEATVYPGATQICDGLNNDCNLASWPAVPTVERDHDLDGWLTCEDCSPGNPYVYPGAPELCDGLRNDCDTAWSPALEVDDDGDGLAECQADCDDTRAAVYPGAPQVCDGLNNDCSQAGWPSPVSPDADLDQDGWRECAGDCDDTRPSVYPNAGEVCDNRNNNCNDPSWPALPPPETDLDEDGFTECQGDCDPAQPTVYPGAPEVCDGMRNNCSVMWNPAVESDDDLDGFAECAQDCNDNDVSSWAPPAGGLVLQVSFDRFTQITTLAWSAPDVHGGTLVRYDVLRNDFDPLNFLSAECVESDESADLMAAEPPVITHPFLSFYLVRAQNGCPGTGTSGLGTWSDGTPRTGRACP